MTGGIGQVIEHVPGQPRIAYARRGSGAPLVFLHGIGGNHRNWDAQLEAFATSHTAVAWDARGYGGSDGAAARFEDFADDLARLVRHLGGGPAHIVGLSMGGRIALDAWNRFPDLIRSLTLADTSAGSAETAAPEKVQAFLALRLKPLIEEGKTPADIAESIVAGIAGPNITPAQREALLDSHRRLRTEGYVAAMRATTAFTAFPAFAAIDVPVLVITGSEDRVAPPAHAQRMAGEIPGARLAVIEGAGHISNIEAPDRFNAALSEFLGDLERRRAA